MADTKLPASASVFTIDPVPRSVDAELAEWLRRQFQRVSSASFLVTEAAEGGGGAVDSVSGANSVSANPTTGDVVVQLENDGTPNPSQYYGTDGAGNRGYHNIPTGGGGSVDTVSGADSVAVAPTTGDVVVRLQNDGTPTGDQYYGTNNAGTRGYYDLPTEATDPRLDTHIADLANPHQTAHTNLTDMVSRPPANPHQKMDFENIGAPLNGEWESRPGTGYPKHAVVRSGPWTSISNVDANEDDPKPQVGVATWVIDNVGTPTWVTQTQPVGGYIFGQQYTFPVGAYLSGYKLITPAGSENFTYTLYRRELVGSIYLPWQQLAIFQGTTTLTEREVGVAVELLVPGTVIQIGALVTANVQSNTFTANWDIKNENGDPSEGEMNFQSNNTEMRFHKTDKDDIDRATQLEAVEIGGTIEFAGNLWNIINVDIQGSHVRYTVEPDQGRPSEDTRAVTFKWGSTDPVPYVEDDLFWPAGGNVLGFEGTDSDALTYSDSAYGTDIFVIELIPSDKWDLIAYSAGAGSFGGGGTGAVESVAGDNSVAVSPTTGNVVVQLQGDGTPTADQYYGTDNSATLGYYDLPAGGGGAVDSVTGADSVSVAPTTGDTIVRLQGDSATPGNLQYYGTDGGGVRGFYPAVGFILPSQTINLSNELIEIIFQSNPGNIRITFDGLYPATNNQQALLRVSTDGGSSYIATSLYTWASRAQSSGTPGDATGIGESEVSLISGTNAITFDPSEAVHGYLDIYNPASLTSNVFMAWDLVFQNNAGFLNQYLGSAFFDDLVAVDAIRIFPTAGVWGGGTVRVYYNWLGT